MKTSAKRSRKVNFQQGKRLIDDDTGESFEVDMVVESDQVDINFQKIWIGHILSAIDEISNKKVKLLFWLFHEASRNGSENIVLMSGPEIAKATGISRPTIDKTLSSLVKHNIIVRKPGVILINPDVIFKGRNKKRMNVLIRYKEKQLSLFDDNLDSDIIEQSPVHSLPAHTDDDSRIRQETETLEERQISRAG